MRNASAEIQRLVPELQARFAKIDKIDPNGPLANKMRELMDKIDNADALRIIYRAQIKFVSNLALVRLIQQSEKV